MAVVDLTLTRLDRLEKAQRETNNRFGRVVDVLEVHSRHFERMEDALLGISERVGRWTTAVARDLSRAPHMCYDPVRPERPDRRDAGLEWP